MKGKLVKRGPGGIFLNSYSSINWLRISKKTRKRKIFPNVMYSRKAILEKKQSRQKSTTSFPSLQRAGKDWVNTARAKYKHGASREEKESPSKAKKSFNLLHQQADAIRLWGKRQLLNGTSNFSEKIKAKQNCKHEKSSYRLVIDVFGKLMWYFLFVIQISLKTLFKYSFTAGTLHTPEG